MPNEVLQKVILVTGANRGIGLEAVRQLSAQGHEVFAATRSLQNRPRDLVANNLHWLELDVTDTSSVEACVAELKNRVHRIDVLINNAAVMDHEPLAKPDIDNIRSVMETNFYGPMHMNVTCLPHLLRSQDPRIINVTSTMGILDSMGGQNAGYRLSKAGLNAQTVILANELNGRVRVNAVCPGWVKTDMGGTEAPGRVEDGADSIVWLATARDIPNGRFIRGRRVHDW